MERKSDGVEKRYEVKVWENMKRRQREERREDCKVNSLR